MQVHGAVRINQDNNGVKGDDSIVIPKYDLNDIIKEESIKVMLLRLGEYFHEI